MFSTCFNVRSMKMIQIRNVPDELHRKLKSRAAAEGVSLSDYLLRIAEREAARPTPEELAERVRRLARAKPGESAVELIRRGRAER